MYANGYNSNPSAKKYNPSRAHRWPSTAEQSRGRADGGRHRSSVPHALQAHGRRLRGVGNGRGQSAAVGHRKIAPANRSRGEVAPIAVQIAGADPLLMADAARYNVDRGAQIIDINMGCPAKKVCNAAAGSALLANEPLVARIVAAVVRAVDVPVTLKIRTGPRTWRAQRASRIARIARGRRHRRARRARPHARVPVRRPRRIRHGARGQARGAHPGVRERRHRNAGDARARSSTYTGADGLMIGRAAQGRPWIFREIAHYLATGAQLPPPTVAEARAAIVEHLADHYAFYGEVHGVRIARKHLHWYTERLPGGDEFRHAINAVEFGRGADRRRSSNSSRGSRRHGERLRYAARAAAKLQWNGRKRGAQRTRGAARTGARRHSRREKEHSTEQRQRNRPQRREIAGRILPPARRRTAAWHLRHGDRACRARAAHVDPRSVERQPDARGRNAGHEPQHAAREARQVQACLPPSRMPAATDASATRRAGAAVGLRQVGHRRTRARPRRAAASRCCRPAAPRRRSPMPAFR